MFCFLSGIHVYLLYLQQLTGKTSQWILKPEILKDTIDNLAVSENKNNYLPLKEFYIGIFAKSLLDIMLNEGDIDERDQRKVFHAAQVFYKENLAYILQKLPLNDSFWNVAIWINYLKLAPALWSDITCFCTRFVHVLNFNQRRKMLYDQFLDYPTMEDIEIKDAKLKEPDRKTRTGWTPIDLF